MYYLQAKNFKLSYNDNTIKSALGNHDISHENEDFLIAIRDEIQSFGEIRINEVGAIEPIFFSLYAIYSDYLSLKIKDNLINNLASHVFADMTFVTNAGPERNDQINANAPIFDFFDKYCW